MKEIENIAIERLRFDPENPRLPSSIREEDDTTIITYMVVNENLFDLVLSINEQGYFAGEPLLLTEEEGSDKYLVVEGNRRLAALKLLIDPSLTKRKRNSLSELLGADIGKDPIVDVPCLVYQGKDQLLDYLGYRHITGVDAWDSLAKARYLSILFERHHRGGDTAEATYSHLARLIGSTRPYVKKLIEGHAIFKFIEKEEYFGIEGLKEETFKFSLLTTAVSYTNISGWLELQNEDANISYNEDRLSDLTRYIFQENSRGDTKIPDSRDLGKFAKVVAVPAAFAKFQEGLTLEEAEVYTDGPLEALVKLLDQSLQRIKGAQDTLRRVQTIYDPKTLTTPLSELESIAADMKYAIEGRVRKARKHEAGEDV